MWFCFLSSLSVSNLLKGIIQVCRWPVRDRYLLGNSIFGSENQTTRVQSDQSQIKMNFMSSWWCQVCGQQSEILRIKQNTYLKWRREKSHIHELRDLFGTFCCERLTERGKESTGVPLILLASSSPTLSSVVSSWQVYLSFWSEHYVVCWWLKAVFCHWWINWHEKKTGENERHQHKITSCQCLPYFNYILHLFCRRIKSW